MDIVLQAIFLGIVQGLAEFIPISSSAHLIIVPWLFQWDNPVLESLTYDVALHLGTLIALLWFFANDWIRLLRAGLASVVERKVAGDPDRKLAWYLVLGTIPGGVVGVLAEDKITELFHQPNAPVAASSMIAVAGLLALMGLILFLADHLARHTVGMGEVSLKDALIVGVAQAFAIFPGVSRSGSTITAGLALGLDRSVAARFSFLLSAPIIAGAGLKSLYDIAQGVLNGTIPSSDLVLFPIGLVAAAISGYLCIKYLLQYLQKHSTDVFVYYRWVIAALVVIVALLRG